MKIALVSDLHLEFAQLTLPKTDAEVLLLAGDIVPIAYLVEQRTDAEARSVKKRTEIFIAETLSQYKTVYHIMGNHEYYKGIWETTAEEFEDYWYKHAPQVKVLNNEAVELGDGLFLWGGTLWTDFAGGNPVHMEAAKFGMNDYHLINHEDGLRPYRPYGPKDYISIKLKPEDTQEEHENARYELKEAVETHPDVKWIVMTHHLPSWRSIPDKFAGSPLNWGYASDLDPFIETHPQIKTWVHGHTHVSQDYNIEGTRILCNPRGYANPNKPNSPENVDFNPGLVFEV